ncbi:uncharacterized protein LOC129583386 [Paramacrobiotus metropolitanus]|uniref:uncharacterized protein LOC129583386 n=1 Tax=Paramacrobiotus metropolitanus TaxID=2943436 RepID=UPI002445DF8F|nr:uncharacterized protein LOC129583386 [Paramacrobiotus metropolitanus]
MGRGSANASSTFPGRSRKNSYYLRETSEKEILPPYFWRFVQGFGVLPANYIKNTDNLLRPRTLNRCLLAWSIVLVCLIAVYMVIRVGNYADFYRKELKELEFFTLIHFMCFVSAQLQVILILVIICFKAKHIPGLLYKLQQPLLWYNEDNEIRNSRWPKVVSTTAMLWILISVALPFASIRFALELWNMFDEAFEYSRDDPDNPSQMNFFGLLKAPELVWVVLDAVQTALILSITNASQMLTFVIVLAIGRGFAHQARQICDKTEVFNSAPESWKLCRNNVGKLLECVAACNDIFGWINLIVCVQDLLNLINYMDLSLQQTVKEAEDNEEEVYVKFYDRQILRVQNAVPFGISVINLGLRFAVCSYCQEQGQNVGVLAERCSLESSDDSIRNECRLIQLATLRVNGSTVITAAGFASLTKEYFAALFGLALTYFILIYQARDIKQDMLHSRNRIVEDLKHDIRRLINGSRSSKSDLRNLPAYFVDSFGTRH